MGIFIRIEIDPASCVGSDSCGQCIRVCPVGIFKDGARLPIRDESNEDECTLCDLCLQACDPNAITIHRLYDK